MNYLNLDEKDLDKPIYRIFNIDHFEDTLLQDRITLVRPKLWEDPFENFLYNYYKNKFNDNNKAMRWYGSELFAQCWTLRNESDAMWRIYSSDKKGIKVKTTIRKLFDCLLKIDSRSNFATCFIGKVEYLKQNDLVQTLSNPNLIRNNLSSDTAHHRASALLIKRREFDHEKEIRLIFERRDKIDIRNNNLIDIPISYNDLFESISLDPRLKKDEFMHQKNKLIKLGFKNRIYQSRLYKLPFENKN